MPDNTLTIKRQIIADSEGTGIRKRLSMQVKPEEERNFVEAGNALEAMTQSVGWVHLETYMLSYWDRALNDDDARVLAKGFKHLMQYVDQMIRFRNQIIQKERDAAANKEN